MSVFNFPDLYQAYRVCCSILFALIQKQLRKAVRKAKLVQDEAVMLRWLVYTILKHDVTKHCVFRGKARDIAVIPPHKRLSEAAHNKGLPIGNLTSQFFANVYLNELDQFVKHTLKCRYYIRYVDDFVILGRSVEELLAYKHRIQCFLRDQLRLKLRDAYYLKSVDQGVDFLGYIVRPHYCLVRRRVIGNLRQRLQHFQSQCLCHEGQRLTITHEHAQQLRAIIASYWGHLKHASSYRLKQSLLEEPYALSVVKVVAVELSERYRGGLKKRFVSHIEFNRVLL